MYVIGSTTVNNGSTTVNTHQFNMLAKIFGNSYIYIYT